jgi:hypothetical protein
MIDSKPPKERSTEKDTILAVVGGIVLSSERCSDPFSDSLGRGFLRSSDAGSCIERPPRAPRMASESTYAAWEGSTCCGGE